MDRALGLSPRYGYQLAAGTALPPPLLDDEAVALAVGLRAAAQSAVENVSAEMACEILHKPGLWADGHNHVTSLSAVSHDGEIAFSRVFGAPRELVYRAFVDPDQFCQWFGPSGFSVPCETVQSDARPGGFQRFVLLSDADPEHRTPVEVTLSEVVEDELLVAHADIGAIAGGRTARIRVRLEFLDQASGGTRLELRQGPPREELCGDPEAAWESSFTRLDALLRRSL